MNINVWVLVAALVIQVSALLTMYLVINRQCKQLDALHKDMLRNQLAQAALDASKETGSMVGPAVLQTLPKEMRKPEPSGTTKEEKKKSGVTLRY